MPRRLRWASMLLRLAGLLVLVSCAPAAPPLPETTTPSVTLAGAPATVTPKAGSAFLARALAEEVPATAVPTASSTPVPTATRPPTAVPPTPTITPTPTPLGPCTERAPDDDLYTLVTLEYALSKAYEPADLVPIGEYLPRAVTLGYPTEVRREVLDPLLAMIAAMQEAGLHPVVQSGYRSFIAQALAWDKWNRLYPEHASIISAPPGHSEHQLGTAVDFGSPELAGLVGQPGIEFHTDFAKTSEGRWLAEHAHEYGFTMSYTLDAFEISGFYYEPWHFRYVGIEMAQHLRDQNLTLTELQLRDDMPPCLP